MAATASSPIMLDKVEESLALMRPFGDGEYINDCTRIRYEQRLEMIAELLPEARALLEALRVADPVDRYRVVGDPVVRDSVHVVLGHYRLHLPQHDLEDCVSVLREATRHLTARTGALPLAAGARPVMRLGPQPYHGWCWQEERYSEVFARRFRHLLHTRLAFLTPLTPDAHIAKNLRLGAELLGELLPMLSCSALTHTHLVVVADAYSERPRLPWEGPSFTSVTNPHILGTIFLAPYLLQNPWKAAEYLLHESLHQKFLDLEHTHSMLRRGYTPAESPTINPPWHRARASGPERWEVNRAISVVHVYTALALFFTRVQQRSKELEGKYGPVTEDMALAIRQSFDRATFLGEKLLGAKNELGLAGQRFLDWLNETVRSFDPEPPPPGAYVHLLLDLYDREAKDIAKRLERASPADLQRDSSDPAFRRGNAFIPNVISHLVESEVASARRVLTALGRPVPTALGAADSSSTLSTESSVDLAQRFSGARASISQALRRVPWAEYRVTHPGAHVSPEESVRDMLTSSGRHLNQIIQHLSSQVQA